MRAAAVGLLLAVAAFAPPLAAERLDDSPSPRQQVVAQIAWAERAGHPVGEDRLNALVARVSAFELRLDTRAYVGQQARIYVRLPQALAGYDVAFPARLSWQARGTFLSGEAEQGQRGLLYEGPISAGQMGDILDFSILLDARSYDGTLALTLDYEIEPQ